MRFLLFTLSLALAPICRAADSRKGREPLRPSHPAVELSQTPTEQELPPADDHSTLEEPRAALEPGFLAQLEAADPALAASLAQARKETGREDPAAPAARFSQWLGEGWKSGSFESGGFDVHYAFAEGSGEPGAYPVVAFHGRALGLVGFQRLAEAVRERFPGHPVVLVERPGYSLGAPGERLGHEDVYRANSSAFAKAIDLARLIGNGEKAALLTHSLSAMLLPRLDPEKVLGAALIDPGVFGMIKYPGAAALMETIDWLPSFMASPMIQATAGMIVSDLRRRIERAGDVSSAFKAAMLGWLGRMAREPGFSRLLFQETRWALRASPPASYLGGPVPVFIGRHEGDEIVSDEAIRKLESDVRRPGRRVHVESRPGTHLSFLGDPRDMLRELKAFFDGRGSERPSRP